MLYETMWKTLQDRLTTQPRWSSVEVLVLMSAIQQQAIDEYLQTMLHREEQYVAGKR